MWQHLGLMIADRPRPHLGTFARVSIGKVRPDWTRSAARKRDLSFWSGDVPLFVTRAGKLIPSESNSPTAWLDVFRAPGLLALDYGAYPSRSQTRRSLRGRDPAALDERAHGLLAAFFRRTISGDGDLCADLAAWVTAIGTEALSDDRQELHLRRPWEKDYSRSGVWDPAALGRSIGGAVFLEIKQVFGATCFPSKGRIADWAGLEKDEEAMGDMPVHTALAWPRRRRQCG
jgi:hypothetical protein